jgi:hypothetical protein
MKQARGNNVKRGRRIGLGAVALAVLLAGCLEEPGIDERWTLLEFLSSTPKPGQTAPSDQPLNVSVNCRVTYRRILTGFVVAEVRYSATIPPSSVVLLPGEHTLRVAEDVDRILANSVTAGRATHIVTGWDHLMQDLDLSFTARVPAQMFAGGPDPTGGLYLILYMGDGDEIELADGRDSLVVTPFVSSNREILHTGYALEISPPAGGP